MDARTAPNAETMRNEVPALRHLLKTYIDDETFVLGKQPGRLIYFIDAHELKAYINPDQNDQITGFALEAERALFDRADGSKLRTEVKLKSERVLNELLFEQDDQVILLPSHSEEVEEEIAFHEDRWLRHRIRTLDDAREQVRALRARTLSGGLMASHAEAAQRGDAASKRRLIDFIHSAAPALLALLRPAPDTPKSRVDALVDRSNLVRLADVDWEAYGFGADACARLRALQPDRALAERWRDYLSSRPGRQRNSIRANRVDGEAVAFLVQLNAELAGFAPRARAVLVTRAMTLINTARDRDAAKQADLLHCDCLRHPRLLMLGAGHTEGAPTAPHRPHQPLKGRLGLISEQALAVALETYERQLKEQRRGALEAASAGARNLVEAWGEFEQVRFTFGLKARVQGEDATDSGAALDDDNFQRLLQWLRSDQDVESLVLDHLREAIQDFGRKTYAQAQPEDEKTIQARTFRLGQPGRVRVLPVVAGAPGPVHFSASSLPRVPAKELDLEMLLGNLPGPASERYLAWALLHGCRARWRLSEIYAQSALESAKLQRGERQRLVSDETRLLLAQVRRLRGMEEIEHSQRPLEAAERYEAARRQLAQVSRRRDPRVLRECAAQLLELHLNGGRRLHLPPLEQGLHDLGEALRLAEGDELVRAKISELGLTYALALHYQPGLQPGLSVDARTWHAELRSAMEALRRGGFHPDELSRRARAMEIIGYQLSGEPVPEGGSSTVGSADAERRSKVLMRPGIPPALRLGLRELHDQIARGADEASRLVTRELSSVAQRLQRYRQRDLIYAPVWTHYGFDAILAEIADAEARRLATRAYDLLRDLTAEQQVLDGGARERRTLVEAEESLAAAIGALQAGNQDGSAGKVLFYLRMERCYAQLLASRLEPQNDLRKAQLERLGEAYRAITEAYPPASVPHYRRSIVLYELGQRTEAFRAIRAALELVADDPYLTQREHWVRSTIRRRMGIFFEDEASQLMEQLKINPENRELRELYLTNLRQAFEAVYTDFTSSASDHEHDYLKRLETRRRLNNIVYYATIFIEGGGDWSALERLSFTPEIMRAWVTRLHNESIGDVPERNIVHTIGSAYHLLRECRLAREAGERLVQLIVDSGDDPQEDGVGRLLSDAFEWMRADSARQPGIARAAALV